MADRIVQPKVKNEDGTFDNLIIQQVYSCEEAVDAKKINGNDVQIVGGTVLLGDSILPTLNYLNRIDTLTTTDQTLAVYPTLSKSFANSFRIVYATSDFERFYDFAIPASYTDGFTFSFDFGSGVIFGGESSPSIKITGSISGTTLTIKAKLNSSDNGLKTTALIYNLFL